MQVSVREFRYRAGTRAALYGLAQRLRRGAHRTHQARYVPPSHLYQQSIYFILAYLCMPRVIYFRRAAFRYSYTKYEPMQSKVRPSDASRMSRLSWLA